MNSVIENTLYNLTSQRRLEEISEDQLASIISEYPFFAPSQLLYSLKLKKEEHFKSRTQILRTALFFNNAEWLSYHLQNDTDFNFEIQSYDTLHKQEIVEETIRPVTLAETIPVSTAPQHFQHIEIPTLEDVQGIMKGSNTTVENIEVANDVRDEVAEVNTVANEASEVPVIIAEVAAITAVANKAIDEPKAEVEAPLQHHTEITPAIQDSNIDEYDADFTDEQENDFDENEDHSGFSMAIPQSISNQLADAKAGLSKHLHEDALEIKYDNEPYHSVDYFDSQGIKLDLSKLPQDKLTRQLLKFTDWLKRVKTVNPNPNDLGTEPEQENMVQNIALHSNDTREIHTETMAEVYAKQGKLDKAIQIYIKLSFLNPEKTAYFAKKIQELKGL